MNSLDYILELKEGHYHSIYVSLYLRGMQYRNTAIHCPQRLRTGGGDRTGGGEATLVKSVSRRAHQPLPNQE